MKNTTLLLFVLCAGCGDDAGSIPDGSPPIDAPESCPAGQICLRSKPVVPGATIPDGRLAVVFFQINDDLAPPPPPFVGYDVPLFGTATAVQIPLADVRLPATIDDYRQCARTCMDLANPACDCQAAGVKVALAFVVAASDTDQSGSLDPAELDDSKLYGSGYLGIGAADKAYPPPSGLDQLFPEGISNGIAPYRIIDTGTFDDLGAAAPGSIFELDLCVPGSASCDLLRLPNLT